MHSVISNDTKQVSVGSMTQDGPAASAGIKVGDVLKEIDGTDVFRRPVKEFSHLIVSGAPGSTVEMTLIKKSNGDTYTARVQRVNASSIAAPPLPAAPGSPGLSPEKEQLGGSPQKALAGVAPIGASASTATIDPNKGVVGFSVQKEESRWTIGEIFPDTPASREPRLKKGSVILELNGQSTMELRFPQMKDLIQGPPNTDLKITLKKGWFFGSETIVLKRAPSKLPDASVPAPSVPGSVSNFLNSLNDVAPPPVTNQLQVDQTQQLLLAQFNAVNTPNQLISPSQPVLDSNLQQLQALQNQLQQQQMALMLQQQQQQQQQALQQQLQQLQMQTGVDSQLANSQFGGSVNPPFGGSVNPPFLPFIQPDGTNLQGQQANGLNGLPILGLLNTLPMQQAAVNALPASSQQLQFDQEKPAAPIPSNPSSVTPSNPSSVDFQAGSVQAKARFFSQVAQQATLPSQTPNFGSAPAPLNLQQTPQGINFNALSLPSQQLSNDIDDETILRLPDGDNIPAHEIEKNLLNALPCVSHAIVFGSNRPLLAALLVLKSSNNNDPSLPLSSEGLFLAAQFNSSATTAR